MAERLTAPAWLPVVVEAFHGWYSLLSDVDGCKRGPSWCISDDIEVEVAERGRSVKAALATIDAAGGLWTGNVDPTVAIPIEAAVESFNRFVDRTGYETAIGPGWEAHQAQRLAGKAELKRQDREAVVSWCTDPAAESVWRPNGNGRRYPNGAAIAREEWAKGVRPTMSPDDADRLHSRLSAKISEESLLGKGRRPLANGEDFGHFEEALKAIERVYGIAPLAEDSQAPASAPSLLTLGEEQQVRPTTSRPGAPTAPTAKRSRGRGDGSKGRKVRAVLNLWWKQYEQASRPGGTPIPLTKYSEMRIIDKEANEPISESTISRNLNPWVREMAVRLKDFPARRALFVAFVKDCGAESVAELAGACAKPSGTYDPESHHLEASTSGLSELEEEQLDERMDEELEDRRFTAAPESRPVPLSQGVRRRGSLS